MLKKNKFIADLTTNRERFCYYYNLKIVKLRSSQESKKKKRYQEYIDEIVISSFINVDNAKEFINRVKIFKKENQFTQIFIFVDKGWHSDSESRKILFEYLKQTHDKVIIESSPVLRAIFKTELIMIDGDPRRVLKKRPNKAKDKRRWEN